MTPGEKEHGSLKRKDRSWESSTPTSLEAPISPPRRSQRQQDARPALNGSTEAQTNPTEDKTKPSLAAIEAGEAEVQDHLLHFSTGLSEAIRKNPPPKKQLSIPGFRDLYARNQDPHGHHFVVHQHDHPLAGVHYDLRLQFSESSSISFAIMYGLPGDPNSRRLNRNATETRVHNVWNHLIETASARTGSLLIWDTGEYEILPFYEKAPSDSQRSREGEASDGSEAQGASFPQHENEKLIQAFHNRKIRLRLHGTRLPPNYTVSLRLSYENDRPPYRPPSQRPIKPVPRRRRRIIPSSRQSQPAPAPTPTPSPPPGEGNSPNDSSPSPEADIQPRSTDPHDNVETDASTRLTNAYPGATNSIGSIHQRKWYMSFDRRSSGFTPTRQEHPNRSEKRWLPRPTSAQDKADEKNGHRCQDTDLLGPFHVLGPAHERSIVTNRLGKDIFADEGVTGWVGRQGWRAVTE